MTGSVNNGYLCEETGCYCKYMDKSGFCIASSCRAVTERMIREEEARKRLTETKELNGKRYCEENGCYCPYMDRFGHCFAVNCRTVWDRMIKNDIERRAIEDRERHDGIIEQKEVLWERLEGQKSRPKRRDRNPTEFG